MEQDFRDEKDPNGTGQHEPGAKLDAGKQRADLVLAGFARALEGVIRVGTYGTFKYSDNGWQCVSNGISRYADARGRHFFRRKKGELLDSESRMLHLEHEAWNVLAELELTLREMEK